VRKGKEQSTLPRLGEKKEAQAAVVRKHENSGLSKEEYWMGREKHFPNHIEGGGGVSPGVKYEEGNLTFVQSVHGKK